MDVGQKYILYLSYDGMTDPLGQSQVLPYLSGLSSLGYKFTLVSFEKEENFGKRKADIVKICNESNIDWHPMTYTKKPAVLSTVYDIIRLSFKCSSLFREKKFDIVHCRSYITAFIGLRLKRKFGTKFVFDMRGFWVDERVEGGLWNIKNPVFYLLFKFMKLMESKFLKNADHIVSITENAKLEMKSWDGMQDKSADITVIPCCTDMNHFSGNAVTNQRKRELKSQLGIAESDYVLSYLGSIGTWYMLDEMLGFFAVLKSGKPNARFLFVTNEQPQSIYSKAKIKGISEKDIVIISASRSNVPECISLSDFSVYFIRPSYSKQASSPTKLGELMSMGIPVVTNKGIGDTDKTILDCNAGILIRNFSEESYKVAINQMLLQSFDRESIRKGASEFFALERGVKLYQRIYQKLSGK